ncbi:MAG: hypothetical protein JKY85_03870 [Porticoccus sp.]|nr:hypothetical protein [Porticoccus sp.]
MKKSTLFTLLLVLSALAAASSNEKPIPFQSQQVWTGNYFCSQGDTKLHFEITSVAERSLSRNGPINLSAIFKFNTNVVSGAFTLKGTYNPANRSATFNPDRWISQPPGFTMAGMSGIVSNTGNSYSGRIILRGCSNFQLTTKTVVKLKQTHSKTAPRSSTQPSIQPKQATKTQPELKSAAKVTPTKRGLQPKAKPLYRVQDAPDFDPKKKYTPVELLRKAEQFFSTRNYEEAALYYNEYLDTKPGYGDWSHTKGRLSDINAKLLTDEQKSLYFKASGASGKMDYATALKLYIQLEQTNPYPGYLKTVRGYQNDMRAFLKENEAKDNVLASRTLLTAGTKQTAAAMQSELNKTIKQGERMQKAVDAGKTNITAQKEYFDTKILPKIKTTSESVLANLAKAPTSHDAYNNAVSDAIAVKGDISRVSLAWEFTFALRTDCTLCRAATGRLWEEIEQYRKQYSGLNINIEQFTTDLKHEAWYYSGTRNVLKKYYPHPDPNREYYPATVHKVFNSIVNKEAFYWAKLDENSTPKVEARKLTNKLASIDGLQHAMLVVNQSPLYANWSNVDHYPQPIRSALLQADERRRAKGKKQTWSMDAPSPSPNSISYYGFAVGYSSKADVIDTYTSVIENNLGQKATNFPKMGINTTGLFNSAFYLKNTSKWLNDGKTEIFCMGYRAIHNDARHTTDCFYFQNDILAGFKLNLSQSKCFKLCEGYKKQLDWLSNFQFKKTNYKEKKHEKKVVKQWLNYSNSGYKMNFTLWNLQRVSETVQTTYFIKDEYVSYTQNSELCLFPNHLENKLMAAGGMITGYTCSK